MVLGKLDDDVKNEATELGMMLHEQLIGWGAVVLVTDPGNSVEKLTLEQAQDISGEVPQLGGCRRSGPTHCDNVSR